MNRIEQVFVDAKAAGRKALLPFLTAGYPSMDATVAMLHEIERRGATICELGVPFSDPVADGPTIQASYVAALESGFTVQQLLDGVKQYRAAGGKMALLAMVSYSIVFRHGVEAFCRDAAEAGFDGLIVPDIPFGQPSELPAAAEANGLSNVLLISPTTPEDRRVEIAKASHGFVYFMSIAGITGERVALPQTTIDAVAELETHTETPICVGFGISNPEMVGEVCRVADGAIVGSAIIHRINDTVAQNAPQEQTVQAVGEFVEQLLQPTK